MKCLCWKKLNSPKAQLNIENKYMMAENTHSLVNPFSKYSYTNRYTGTAAVVGAWSASQKLFLDCVANVRLKCCI